MKRDDPQVHSGALKQAIHLLRWWAANEGDDPEVLEAVKQSREAARAMTSDLRKWQRRRGKR